jgi:hypothetical protein
MKCYHERKHNYPPTNNNALRHTSDHEAYQIGKGSQEISMTSWVREFIFEMKAHYDHYDRAQ